MAENKKDVTSAIVEFCKQYCKQTVGIMVFGSYVEGTNTEQSDVDFIVIDEAEVEGKKIQSEIYGYPLQATIVNFKALLNLLENSSSNRHFFYPHCISKSEILLDGKGMCAYLKKRAGEIVTKGVSASSVKKMEAHRISLCNFLHDGMNEKYTGSAIAEKLMWSNRVVMMCHNYILSASNDWDYTNAKLKRTVLIAKHPKVYASLNKLIEEFISHFDCPLFAQQIKSVMSDYMTFSWDTTAPHHCSMI